AGMPNPFQPDDRVLGAPGWMQTQRFDIVASAGREISRDEAHEMLRTLLAERFKLVVVREQRKSDAYALRLARADGRLGPDLHRVADDCSVTRPKDPFDRMKLLPHPSNGAGPSFATACATTESIAAAIAAIVNATVIDETGLSGRWDFVISHAGLQSGIVRGPNGMEERPSIHVAVQEQLGLKLERRQGRGSFEVLVIKSAEQPTEN
ncbi:MAG: TIGR03435 family protein, partial [Vicinamibacterales bacterium]